LGSAIIAGEEFIFSFSIGLDARPLPTDGTWPSCDAHHGTGGFTPALFVSLDVGETSFGNFAN
jgi:hypothetical protein